MGLTSDDCRFILESLDYTRQAFEAYRYPSEEIKAGRLQDVRDVILKVRALRDELKQQERRR